MTKETRHSWREADAQCPFFQHETGRAIVCEGLTRGEVIRRRFRNEAACSTVFLTNCARRYEDCPIFQLVYGTYTDGRKR